MASNDNDDTTAGEASTATAETSLTVIHTVDIDRWPIVIVLPDLDPDHPTARDHAAVLELDGRQVRCVSMSGERAMTLRERYERAQDALARGLHFQHVRLMEWIHEFVGI